MWGGCWAVEPEFSGTAVGEVFASLDKSFMVEGEEITRDGISHVVKARVGDKYYYVKRYTSRGNGIGRWIGPRKSRGEWKNLLLFRQLGIAVPPIVAYGKKGQRGVLVTEEVVDTMDLSELAKQNAPQLQNAEWVAQVNAQVAEGARRMHAKGFAHNDLKWRNLLVTPGADPKVYFIDCPSGRFWRWPLLEYRIIKDLACLDKVAKYHLTKEQRQDFYHRYAGREMLTPRDEKRLKKIDAFFAGRE